MAQNNITVSNDSGYNVRTGFNEALQSSVTFFSGATDPSTLSPTCAFANMIWADTGNDLIQQRNTSNDDWATIGKIKSDGSFYFFDQSSTLASAATLDIDSENTTTIFVTGTTGITSLGTPSYGAPKITLIFSGIVTITYSASAIILPDAEDITTAAGDVLEFVYKGSGIWQCTNYRPITSIYAKLDSPALTGTPTAPTAIAETRTTQIATTAFLGLNSNFSDFKNFVMTVTGDTAATIMAGNNPYTGATSLSLTLDMSTTGANALDTGTIASSTIYDIYVCYGTSGTCCLAVVEGDTPSVPSGYDTVYLKVGCLATTSGSILCYTIQRCRSTKFITGNAITVASGSAVTSATALTLNIPSTAIASILSLSAQGWLNVGGNSSITADINDLFVRGIASSSSYANQGKVVIETAQTIYYSVTSAGLYTVKIVGWEDNL